MNSEVLETKGEMKTTLGRYEYRGFKTCNWMSLEWGRAVEVGDVRMINGLLHYAYFIKRHNFKKDEIWWARVDGETGIGKPS